MSVLIPKKLNFFKNLTSLLEAFFYKDMGLINHLIRHFYSCKQGFYFLGNRTHVPIRNPDSIDIQELLKNLRRFFFLMSSAYPTYHMAKKVMLEFCKNLIFRDSRHLFLDKFVCLSGMRLPLRESNPNANNVIRAISNPLKEVLLTYKISY